MKKDQKNTDVSNMFAQLQQQLSALDKKLDSFMGKTMAEFNQLKISAKPAVKSQPISQVHEAHSLSNHHHERKMYTVVCYQCGKDSELPFKPNGNRPVYCKECFAARKGGNKHVIPVKPVMPSQMQLSANPAAAAVKTEEVKTMTPAAKAIEITKTKKTTAVKKDTTIKKSTTVKKKATVIKKAAATKKPAIKKKIVVKGKPKKK